MRIARIHLACKNMRMTSTPDGFTRSVLELHDLNDVAFAADAFLDAARTYRIRLMRSSKANWLFISSWHVVHHLSFISVELYLKSFGAVVLYSISGDESGPFDKITVNGYHSHKLKVDGIPKDIWSEIHTSLPPEQCSLLERLCEKSYADGELSIGRYPFERTLQGEYPSGQEGKSEPRNGWLLLSLFKTFARTFNN
jgi:hypothetical protein